MSQRIYLDNNASTAIDPQVLKVTIDDLILSEGNPSSIHFHGQEMRNRITKARRLIASKLGVAPSEIIFTSGGTEGMNMLIKGFASDVPGHFITSNVEHACVYFTCKELENCGWQGSYLPVGKNGAVTPEQVEKAITSNTRFIALMAVNNETGVKTDIEAIALIASERKIPLIVDGVALLGKDQFSLPKGVLGIAFSGHKIHAPKGIGFVVARSKLKLSPLLIGGSQEAERRGGTENIHGIVGLAEAVAITSDKLQESLLKMQSLRDSFELSLKEQIKNISINGEGPRVCNTSNVNFHGVDGESLLMNLDLAGISVSHGSACSSGALEPSRVLLNMGMTVEEASSSIRFSLSRFTTQEEILRCVSALVAIVERLRS